MVMKNADNTTSSPPPSDRADSKFKGVRKRKWGKYVSEIRLPNSRERIWLGSYDSAEKAARAFDAALFCLRGRNAKFNFPDSPPDIAGGRLLSPAEIQAAASRFANSAASSSVSTSLSDPVPTHSDSDLHRSPSPSPSEGTVGDVSFDAIDNSIWDINQYPYNNNYGSYSYDNINSNMDPGQFSGSGYYPSEFGLYPDLDALPTDFYTPAFPPVDQDNYDSSLNQGSSFLWNF